jgi:hypothetical protein
VALSGFVNNYQTHAEARRKADLIAEIERCAVQVGCSAETLADLQRELAEIENIDRVRDAILQVSCINRISSACLSALEDLNATISSYLGTGDGFNELWADNQRAGLLRGRYLSGPAWDPAAFGVGLVLGTIAVTNAAVFAVTIREAARICGRQPACTGIVASQLIGTEVLVELQGGAFVVSAAGRVINTVPINPPAAVVSGGIGGGSVNTPRTVGNLQGGPLEHATQVSGRFTLESGPPNGTVFRADNQGNVTSYATYDANGRILTRVDVTGPAHNGIPTPHVVVYGRNTLPDGSVRVQTPRTDPRPARPEEIP